MLCGAARHPKVARALYLGFGLQKETVASWVGAFAKGGYARSILSTLRNIPMLNDFMPMYRRVGAHPRPVLLVWGTLARRRFAEHFHTLGLAPRGGRSDLSAFVAEVPESKAQGSSFPR